jgi:hypothetical protein
MRIKKSLVNREIANYYNLLQEKYKISFVSLDTKNGTDQCLLDTLMIDLIDWEGYDGYFKMYKVISKIQKVVEPKRILVDGFIIKVKFTNPGELEKLFKVLYELKKEKVPA